MKPYFETPTITIYQGDCRELSPRDIDCIITDPPYGIAHPCNFASRGRSNLAQCHDYPNVRGDDTPFDPAPLLALGLPTVLWGGNYYADKLPPSGGWLVWDKARPATLDQSTCELAWTNCVKGVRIFRHLWNGCMRASERGESYHPTQKPVALSSWILSLKWLRNYAAIYDPYMGAGGMAVACAQAGRRFVGVEYEEAYCEIAAKRVRTVLEGARNDPQ